MRCKRCWSGNVAVTIQQTSSKVKHKDPGPLHGVGRAGMVMATGGLWLLMGKRSGFSKTKFKNQKIAICQKCGHSWKV